MDELKKKEWKKVLKNHCGEGTPLGFRIAKGRENINYAVLAGSNAIQDQLAGGEELWEKLWTRDKDVDIQKELGGCGLNPRYELAGIKAAASRLKVRTATVDGVHPGMMKFL